MRISRMAPVVLLVVGCGGGQKEAEAPRMMEGEGVTDPSHTAVPESIDMPLTQLERDTVSNAVDEGLGAFLATVEVEPVSDENGKFFGFRIGRFVDKDFWRGVGLVAGDIVISVNDMPIETPDQAYAVFASLKTADVLEVSYLRDEQPMRLSLPIVGDASDEEADMAATAEEPASKKE